ncbi:hypothetical protein SDRG_07733 [Saprolegnia diclina VS20]|uniref:DUF676 domain-containing protein n=1 Tax=Saprolegnia diclina (strain VS20) TaxID=1156394 RepID=T0QMB3_SAPDV|nr:hypothetical protein SDRG_07733 [Saprolegnia diclina VS20]EQC34935.1 hypothetical protein SDRG_07733 [Saprolegnia diclina VS20]|eukprot:XP_008611807.1 hypothetical protein SDRG_07733 [Saprolegnia diclina VS20]
MELAALQDHLALLTIHHSQAEANSSLLHSTMHALWRGRANLLKARVIETQRRLQSLQATIPLSSESLAAKPVLPRHIFVLVHGVYGSPTDLAAIAKKLRSTFADNEMLLLQSRSNKGKTQRGLEKCGSNLAAEISDLLLTYQSSPHGHRISFVGHSLGGLITRQSLVYLQDVFAKQQIQCTSYVSVCSPHLGSRCPGGSPTKNMWKFAVHQVLSMSLIYGKTGHELLFEDNPVAPFLESMSAPQSMHMQALARFKHRTAIAVIEGDQLVPYASASMNPNPLPEMPPHKDSSSVWQWTMLHDGFADTSAFGAKLSAKYPVLPTARPELEMTSDGQPCDAGHEVAISAGMLSNLLSLPWRRMHLQVDMRGIHKVHALNLHVWPVGLMQPSNSRSDEFIDVLVEMLHADHIESDEKAPCV